jgi:hypothetical protein
MEDLRNLEPDICTNYDPTHDAYVLIIEGNAYRMTQDQFVDLHNKVTATLARQVLKC